MLALNLSDRFEYQSCVVAYSQDVLPDLGEQVPGLLVFFARSGCFATSHVLAPVIGLSSVVVPRMLSFCAGTRVGSLSEGNPGDAVIFGVSSL